MCSAMVACLEALNAASRGMPIDDVFAFIPLFALRWLGKEMISLSPPPRRTVRTSHLVHGSSNLRTPRGALLLWICRWQF